MIMLGSFKDRIIGRKRQDLDYNDVRSHVIGDRFSEPLREQTVGEKFGISAPEFPREPYAQEPFQQQFPPRPEPRDTGMWREGSFEQPRMEQRKDYDMMDRLSLI